MMSQGLKQLHAEARKSDASHARSETDSSKESDTPRLTEDENSKNTRIEEISAIKETGENAETKDEHVVTIDEDPTLPKNSSSDDKTPSEEVDAGSTQNESHSSATDAAPSTSTAKSSEETLTIESEVKPSTRRGRNRRRRRRNDNRTSKNNSKPDLKAREVRRVAHVSESSTSSSQHSDDDEIFKMEEYLEEEEELKELPPVPPLPELKDNSATNFGFRGVEEVTPEEWNGLLHVAPNRDFHPLSDGDATPLLR